MRDPYETLGLGRDASKAQIKKAHRKMSMELHPDQPGGDGERFREVQEAFELLIDDDRRLRYDRTGKISSPVTPDRIKSVMQTLIAHALNTPPGVATDPIENMKFSLVASEDQLRKDIKKIQGEILKINKALSRIQNKGDQSLLENILKDQVSHLAKQIENHEDMIELQQACLKVLRDYSYVVSPGSEGQFNPGLTPRLIGRSRITTA